MKPLPTRRLLAPSLLALACLFGGCATGAVRPSPAPSPAAEAPPAHLLDGCRVGRHSNLGFAVKCGSVALTLMRMAGPARVMVKQLEGSNQPGKATVMMTLAGARRKVSVLTVFDTRRRPPVPVLRTMIAPITLGPNRSLSMLCTNADPASGRRCPALLEWFADHPEIPAGLPVAAFAKPHPEWPSEKDLSGLAALAGCKARHSPLVSLDCPTGGVTFQPLDDGRNGPATAADRRQFEATAEENYASIHRAYPGTTIERVPCRVGDDDMVCRLIRAPNMKPGGQVLMGMGHLFGRLGLVTCFSETSAGEVPRHCSPFIRLRRGKAAAPSKVPALFEGCVAFGTSARSYGVRCGSVVAAVAVADDDTTPAELRARLVRQADAQMSGTIEPQSKTTQLPIAGAERTVVPLVGKDAQGNRSGWVGFQTAWTEGNSLTVGVLCGAVGEHEFDRCQDLPDWMADHPGPPAGVPGAPPREKDVLDRLPTGTLGSLHGCTTDRPPGLWGLVNVTCGETTLMIFPYAGGQGDGARRTVLRRVGRQFVDSAKKASPGTTRLSWRHCRVAGQAGTCARVRFGKPLTEAVAGVARLGDGLVSIECVYDQHVGTLPDVCKRVFSLGDEAPAP